MSTPLVSVIVPAYNAEKFVAETIESVQAQTYTHWELIIVDDGSTDQTADIIKEYVIKDSRIQYWYQTNGRQGKARNLAISKAKGIYLAFIDADDLWHPKKLEKQIEVFILNYNVDVIYTYGTSFVGDKSNTFKKFAFNKGLIDKKKQFDFLISGYSLPNLSVIVKRNSVIKVGGFDEDIRVQNAEDYQLWLRLADNGSQFYCLGEDLFYYRIHPNQVTFNDNLAFHNAIWAVFRSDLKCINKSNKLLILNKRVDKYLLHNIDSMSLSTIIKTLKLLINPLTAYYFFLKNIIFLMLGKNIFKKLKYIKFS
jgi:glycosyltransferase involved in cell wall biosynthesis